MGDVLGLSTISNLLQKVSERWFYDKAGRQPYGLRGAALLKAIPLSLRGNIISPAGSRQGHFLTIMNAAHILECNDINKHVLIHIQAALPQILLCLVF